MTWRHPEVERNPDVLSWTPVIRSTRWTTDTVLAGWESIDDILASYPHLTRDQVNAAIRYEFGVIRRAERQAWRIRRCVAAWVLGVSVGDLWAFVPWPLRDDDLDEHVEADSDA